MSSLSFPIVWFIVLAEESGGRLQRAVQRAIERVAEWTVDIAVEAIFTVVEWILSGGITRRLLLLDEDSANFASSDAFSGVDAIYQELTVVFWAGLAAVVVIFALSSMLVSANPQTHFTRLGQRVIIAIMIVYIGYGIWFVALEAHNAIGITILEAGGGDGIGIDMSRDEFGTASGLAATVALGLLLWYLSFSIIIVVLVFWAILALRVVILATIYALTPILSLLWIVDFGGGKYTAQIANLMWALGAGLLILGPVMAALLSTGGALMDQPGLGMASSADGLSSAGEYESDNYRVATGEFEGRQTASGEASVVESGAMTLINLLYPTFIWIGTMWVFVIAVMTMLGALGSGAKSVSPSGGGGIVSSDVDSDDADSLQGKSVRAGGMVRKGVGKATTAVGNRFGSGNANGTGTQQSGGTGNTSGGVWDTVSQTGKKIENTSVVDSASSGRIGAVSRSVKQKHSQLKGESQEDDGKQVTDDEVKSAQSTSVDTVDELEKDKLTDEHVETLTDGNVTDANDFEWADGEHENDYGETVDRAHELDGFDAETLDELKEEVRHDDYDDVVDEIRQKRDLKSRVDSDTVQTGNGSQSIDDMNPDDVEDTRRELMRQNLKHNGLTNEDVDEMEGTEASKVETLETAEMESLEDQLNADPRDSKTNFQKGYSHASQAGDIAKRSMQAYGDVFKNHSGVGAWRAGLDKLRESDALSPNSPSLSDTNTNRD